jgi:hypothetical protein
MKEITQGHLADEYQRGDTVGSRLTLESIVKLQSWGEKCCGPYVVGKVRKATLNFVVEPLKME